MAQNHKQGEGMWPRLVTNKLLQVPVGSNSLVADFPSEEPVEVTRAEKPTGLRRRASDDQKGTLKGLTYNLFASTWNVGGIPPSDDLDLEEWLDTNNNSYDIYVLGFQEIVPLSAKNILGAEKSRISMKWNSVIRATLNKPQSSPRGDEEPMAGEGRYPVKDGGPRESTARDFRCVVSKRMVGVFVSVWVRGDISRYIRQPSVSCVGCGIMGCLGNKGSVSVRFLLHETSFCFVCCHLASGGKEGDEMHRNSDAMDIFSRTIFHHGRKIVDHDRIILLGDLNYRISLPYTTTRSLVEQKEWNTLLEKDQLRGEVSEGRAFEGWQEGVIAFSPTYKYYPNSDEYYGCLHHKKSENSRAPAWCDRILWYGTGIKQISYDRCESKLSDHRPVRGFFIVEVEVSKNLKSLRNFFLSERYDHITSHFEMFSPDDLMSNERSIIQV